MKNKRNKWSTTLAIVMVCALVLAACSNSEKNSSSESENNDAGQVTLKMILLGDKPVDADLVYQELSKMAQKDINAKIEVTNFTWGEWAQKYSLLSPREKIST